MRYLIKLVPAGYEISIVYWTGFQALPRFTETRATLDGITVPDDALPNLLAGREVYGFKA